MRAPIRMDLCSASAPAATSFAIIARQTGRRDGDISSFLNISQLHSDTRPSSTPDRWQNMITSPPSSIIRLRRFGRIVQFIRTDSLPQESQDRLQSAIVGRPIPTLHLASACKSYHPRMLRPLFSIHHIALRMQLRRQKSEHGGDVLLRTTRSTNKTWPASAISMRR